MLGQERKIFTYSGLDELKGKAVRVQGFENVEVKFSGKDTPYLLFRGPGRGKKASTTFQSGEVNPAFTLGFFTDSFSFASSIEHGLLLPKPGTLGNSLFGIDLERDTRYAFVVFPHEDTLLERWVLRELALRPASGHAREFVTDQYIDLQNTLLISGNQWEKLNGENMRTKQELMNALGLTESSQQQLKQDMKDILYRTSELGIPR